MRRTTPRRITRRWVAVGASALLVLGACSSDGDSSAPTTDGTEAEAPATSETTADTTPAADTTPVAPASAETAAGAPTSADTAPDETDGTDTGPDDTVPDGTDATDTSDTSDDSDDATSVTFGPIDDVPVCLSFTRVVATTFFISLVGFAPADGSTSGAIERLELVTYPGLVPDVALFRSEVPADLLPELEPLLQRIEAADDALAAGGFSSDEIAAIAANWSAAADGVVAGGNLDDVLNPADSIDSGQLDAAAEAFVADAGSFEDYEAIDSASENEDAGEAWLNETCPLLTSSLGG